MIENDPFIGAITTSIGNFSLTNSLNWTVVAQNSPNRKEWDNVPMVIVTPSPKREVRYIAFGRPKTVNGYDVFLLNTQDLGSNFSNDAQYLFDCCMSNFMPQNAAMYAAGAYMSRVEPRYDYDRAVFPKGWSSSCVNIEVFYVNTNIS